MLKCPLCQTNVVDTYAETQKGREYLLCHECDYVFLNPKQRLCPVKEQEHYQNHNNDPNDERYIKYLSRVSDPLREILGDAPLRGLDFGCGSGPAMPVIFKEHQIDLYDVYFHPDIKLIPENYDFITCTEVIEHLYDPQKEIELMLECLKHNGYLAIMTEFLVDKEKFLKWFYIADETHIGFYSEKCLSWLESKYKLKIIYNNHKNVLIFKKIPT